LPEGWRSLDVPNTPVTYQSAPGHNPPADQMSCPAARRMFVQGSGYGVFRCALMVFAETVVRRARVFTGSLRVASMSWAKSV
jgi:hypothetical protein